ncbi:MAG: hypothetical protein KC561_19090, partial [Myxococcales bacterium]|nr:hypothetical protein [Myxococcales bacterium]
IKNPLPSELEEAYDSGDYGALLGTNKFSDAYRAYACRCDKHQLKDWTTLQDAYQDHGLNWVCESAGDSKH